MYTLQQNLAQATRELHQRIEDNPFMTALHAKEPLEPSYRWLISSLYPFAAGAEECIMRLLDDTLGLDAGRRCRLPLLLEDLSSLQIKPESPTVLYFESIRTVGEGIGLLYVLEGSRKGGRFLTTLLERQEPQLPTRYLRGYGESTDQEWDHFCALLERYASTPLQEEIVSGALKGFEILERIFHEHR